MAAAVSEPPPPTTNSSSDADLNWSKRSLQTSDSSDVPNAVRKLLFSTKRLQQCLKLWSTRNSTDADVSDIYVQIGHDFNAVIAAFAHYSIDLGDLHCIPVELRVVLERCLSEDPSPQQLENCLPELRKVLYKLLKGLQARQEPWRMAYTHMSPSQQH